MTTVVPTSYGVQSLLLSRFHSAPPKRLGNGRQRASTSIRAMRNDGKRDKRRDSKLVDENMIVLKMRIQETEMKEREKHNLENEEDWYENYDSDVYELVGLLQILMMNNRPSLVLGVFALLVISSSTSFALVFSYLLHNIM